MNLSSVEYPLSAGDFLLLLKHVLSTNQEDVNLDELRAAAPAFTEEQAWTRARLLAKQIGIPEGHEPYVAEGFARALENAGGKGGHSRIMLEVIRMSCPNLADRSQVQKMDARIYPAPDRRSARAAAEIGKWLKAGAMETGQWRSSDEGTPQGAVISPLLANVYLHYVLDLWVNQWRQRHARGEVIMVRYADDFVTGFQYRDDAVRFHQALRERLEKFSLRLHGEKTRLIEFGRFAQEKRERRGEGKVQTFDFPGFTHICARTRNDKFRVLRQSVAERQRAKVKTIAQELRKQREQPIAVQGAWLQSVLRGRYGYHAVPGNLRALGSFRLEVTKRWYRSLCRRSHKKRLTWSKMNLHIRRWLPVPKVQHPYPSERFFAAITRGKSPVR